MNASLVIRGDFAEPEARTAAAADVRVYSRPSPDRDGPNEDAAGVWDLDDGSLVLAVADGMGGTPSGGDAAALAIRELDRQLAGAEPGHDLRPAILDAFERANSAILDLGVGAGTTLVVAWIAEGSVRMFHVGDSAGVVVGQRGRWKLETIAHSPVGYGVAAGLIDPETALDRDDRHYLSNHLGTGDMRIEIGSALALASRDTGLLASDGLLDNLTPDEINRTIRSGPLDAAAAQLAAVCAERMPASGVERPGKPDDVTFVLFRRRSRR